MTTLSKILAILILQTLLSNGLFSQTIKTHITTNENIAAVYSFNGFRGATPFSKPIDFDIVTELFVIGGNNVFEVIKKNDSTESISHNIKSFYIQNIEKKYSDIELTKIKIATPKNEFFLQNTLISSSLCSEEYLNSGIEKECNSCDMFSKNDDAEYILSGVVQNHYVFTDGFAVNWWGGAMAERHRALLTEVIWTLREKDSNEIVLEKKTFGGYYFGKRFKLKSNIYIKEKTTFAYREAVLSSLIEMLRSDEMTSNKYSQSKLVEANKFEVLNINTGVKFCNQLDLCAQSSVTIKTEKGFGSGFFISSNGYILTNFHVIQNTSYPTVILSNGMSMPVEIIRFDKHQDIALLKAAVNGILPIEISKHLPIRSGIDVFAIGTPKDISLGQTISKGIISAYREGDKRMIQTDVSVNAGNSGGPLLTVDNKVIGLITSKVIESGTEGIAFAIPISDALKSLKIELKKE